MKTSRIISRVAIVLLSIFAVTTLASAQTPTPPSTPSTETSSSKSSQKFKINSNGNKLNLKINNDVFDLKMAYDFDASNVIAAITDELGLSMKAGSYQAWEGNGYDIKVKNDNLDIAIDRNTVSAATLSHIEDVCMDLFDDLELDIEINR